MTRTQTAGALTIAAIALMAAFAILRPSTSSPTERTTPTFTQKPNPRLAPQTTDTTVGPARPEPGPLLTESKVTKLEAGQGDTIRFRVRSNTNEELHVHGYDLSYNLKAGQTRAITFPATITGIFEIELEKSGTQIAKLEVHP